MSTPETTEAQRQERERKQLEARKANLLAAIRHHGLPASEELVDSLTKTEAT